MTAVLAQERDRGKAGGVVRRAFHGTPRQLKLLTGLLAVLTALLGLIYALGLGGDSASLGSLDSRTSEVYATNDLYYRLTDMDAQAANALLVGFNPADPGSIARQVTATASEGVYDSDRRAADGDLEQIAANPQLAVQAKGLLDALGSYESLIAQAFLVDQETQNELPATPPAVAVSYYQQASTALHTSLLPTASNITADDVSAVDSSYSSDHSTVTTYGILILVLALLLAAGLVLGNRYHDRKFRRRLGPMLIAAVIAVVLGITGLTTQLSVADNLQTAKQGAFDSINPLTRAQAISTDANADESRWLVEGRDATQQTDFFANALQVAAVGGLTTDQASSSPESYYADLASAVTELQANADGTVSDVQFAGFLGTELGNITFADEGPEALATAQAFNTYVQDDKTIRADADSGNLAGAVALDIGLNPNQSNWAFSQYTSDLGKVVATNEGAFAAAIAQGRAGIGGGAWTLLILGELFALLLVLQSGYARLREYR